MATPGALAAVSADDLIEQIYNGAVPARLAADIGVHKCSVYRHLADHPKYQEARRVGMAVRLDEAEEAVVTADERTLARAREAWRCVTWRAEREHPNTWGQRPNVEVVVNAGADAALGTSIADIFARLAATQQDRPVIEAEPEKSTKTVEQSDPADK